MADSMGFDFSDLTKLAADFGEVADNAGPFINSAVQFTSKEIVKTTAKSVRKGNKRWKALPTALDYEISVEAGLGGSSITSDIGYNLDKPAGPLGHLRESGSPTTTPHNDLVNALHENEADFQHGLEKALLDAEKKAGL